MRTVFTADRLWDRGQILEHPLVIVEDGRIVSVGMRATVQIPAGIEEIDFPGATLAPAYLDVHTHGAAGHDVMEATPEALGAIERFLGVHGTGSYLATTVTASLDTTLRALSGLAKHIGKKSVDGCARLIGIHLEGPFISHLRRGVHPPEHLLAPDIAIFDKMYEAAEGHVRLITLAPELPGAVDLARHASARGVRISLGHSNATAAEARAGIFAGAVSATHTFNAMRPFDHREPGILGVTLATETLFAELICDGIHTAPEPVRIWWRAKGPERAVLVTDSMSATGMPDGTYRLGSLEVEVKDGKATSGGALAGSLLTLDRGVANLIEFTGASIGDALRAVTVNPAAMIGVEDRIGKIEAGQPADFVVVDAKGRLIASIVRGVVTKI